MHENVILCRWGWWTRAACAPRLLLGPACRTAHSPLQCPRGCATPDGPDQHGGTYTHMHIRRHTHRSHWPQLQLRLLRGANAHCHGATPGPSGSPHHFPAPVCSHCGLPVGPAAPNLLSIAVHSVEVHAGQGEGPLAHHGRGVLVHGDGARAACLGGVDTTKGVACQTR
jgi:hypothetical protein